MTEWKRIDDPEHPAPKDGTEFQGWHLETWEPRCRINPGTGGFEIWCRSDYDQEDWCVYGIDDCTHWMPQPEPPRP